MNRLYKGKYEVDMNYKPLEIPRMVKLISNTLSAGLFLSAMAIGAVQGWHDNSDNIKQTRDKIEKNYIVVEAPEFPSFPYRLVKKGEFEK